jgi:hypothetical protein
MPKYKIRKKVWEDTREFVIANVVSNLTLHLNGIEKTEKRIISIQFYMKCRAGGLDAIITETQKMLGRYE